MTGYFGGLLSRRQCFSNLIITGILLIEIVCEDFFRIDLSIFIMICTLLSALTIYKFLLLIIFIQLKNKN